VIVPRAPHEHRTGTHVDDRDRNRGQLHLRDEHRRAAAHAVSIEQRRERRGPRRHVACFRLENTYGVNQREDGEAENSETNDHDSDYGVSEPEAQRERTHYASRMV
jgi:hypothetical protein